MSMIWNLLQFYQLNLKILFQHFKSKYLFLQIIQLIFMNMQKIASLIANIDVEAFNTEQISTTQLNIDTLCETDLRALEIKEETIKQINTQMNIRFEAIKQEVSEQLNLNYRQISQLKIKLRQTLQKLISNGKKASQLTNENRTLTQKLNDLELKYSDADTKLTQATTKNSEYELSNHLLTNKLIKLEIKDQETNKTLILTTNQVSALEDANKKLFEKASELQTRNQHINGELSKANEKISDIESKNQNLHKQVNEWHLKHSQTHDQLTKANEKISEHETKIVNLNQQKDQLQLKYTVTYTSFIKANEIISEYQQLIYNLTKQLGEWKIKYQEAESSYGKINTNIYDYEKRIIKLQDIKTTLQLNISSAEIKQSIINKKNQRLQSENQRLEIEVNDWTIKYQQIHKKLGMKNKNYSDLINRCKLLKEKYKENQIQMQKKVQELTRIKIKLNELTCNNQKRELYDLDELLNAVQSINLEVRYHAQINEEIVEEND